MGDLLGKPKTPAEKPPVRMPDPEDPEVTEAARRRRRMALGSGRDATRMATGADMLSGFSASAPVPPSGSQAYTKTTLG